MLVYHQRANQSTHKVDSNIRPLFVDRCPSSAVLTLRLQHFKRLMHIRGPIYHPAIMPHTRTELSIRPFQKIQCVKEVQTILVQGVPIPRQTMEILCEIRVVSLIILILRLILRLVDEKPIAALTNRENATVYRCLLRLEYRGKSPDMRCLDWS